jgi:hypothetical protein
LIALKLLYTRHNLYLWHYWLVQVCDTVVNRFLKARIEELTDQYTDERERDWVEGRYSVSQSATRSPDKVGRTGLGGYACLG